MPMPETPVHKNGRSVPTEHEVGCSWQFLVIQPKAKSKRVCNRSHNQFRLRILALNVAHHLASH
uniref:Uncharacterized protein n=1 Tax=Ralstonia solanacearum TaxID=305 RepID=A0A0S4WGA4_RALSL|nr:protein of unknown function [Ralstonia solanacearum]